MSRKVKTDGWSKADLQDALGALADRIDLRVFEEIDSTNAEAKRMASEGLRTDRPCLLAAVRQTAGRGRMGRSFYSPADTGAYFSLLYTPAEPLENAVTITSAAAVAVMRAIRRLTALQVQIKWVNDLYWNDKKICGILTEAVTCGQSTHIVIGIGINIRTVCFPEALSEIAGSLRQAELSPSVLIAACTEELLPLLSQADGRGWLEEYRRYSMVLQRPIVWTEQGQQTVGIAREIDADGALLAEDAEGRIHRLYSGEISVKMQSIK